MPDRSLITAAYPADRIAAALPALSELRQVMDRMRDSDTGGSQEF